MATRIAIMTEGRLQQVGPPQAVYERPAQPVRGPLHRQPADEHHRRRRSWSTPARPFVQIWATAASRWPPSGGEPVVDGTKVIVGVRPEHLLPIGRRARSVAATVAAVEWLGHERHVICDVAGTDGDRARSRRRASAPRSARRCA